MALTVVDQGLLGTNAQYTGFKNRIINGAMVIDQRNAGAAFGTSINGYALDRWQVAQTVGAKLNGSQNYNSITPPAGFSNYVGVQSQSAYSVLTGDYYWVSQNIEGLNTADLSWGTASAATVTLSFRVYSSLTGTFGGSISNSAFNRSYPFTYSIPTANTWTTISVTIAGDTSGTWLTTNGIGLRVYFGLGVGATYSGTAGAWAGSGYMSATGATSVVGTSGATFYITGVQLEKGSTATSFDYRPYGTELALCQRYFQKSYNTDVAVGTNTVSGSKTTRIYNTDPFLPQMEARLMVSMRASPTVTWYTTGGTAGSINISGGTNTINTQYDTGTNSTGWMYVNGSVASGNQIQAQYTASSEL
jgi:hypothetical protein